MTILLDISGHNLTIKAMSGPSFNSDRDRINSLRGRIPRWHIDKSTGEEAFMHWELARTQLNEVLSLWNPETEIIPTERAAHLLTSFQKAAIPITELKREDFEFEIRDGRTLKPHQQDIVAIDRTRNKYLLGTVVGSGKTLASFARACRLGFNKLLIIAPISCISDWKREIYDTKDIPYIVYRGDKKKRTKLREELSNYPIIITNYEMVSEFNKHLPELKFEQIIIDEAHNIANTDTVLYKEHDKLIRRNKDAGLQLLTGTAIRNHLGDLWAAVNWINPDLFGSKTKFLSRYRVETRWKNVTTKTGRVWKIPIQFQYRHTDELYEKLKSVMIQMNLSHLQSWEDVTELVNIEMQGKQKELYEQARTALILEVESGELPLNNVLTRVLRLLEISEGVFNVDERCKDSGKLEWLKYELGQADDKVIVWSRFVQIHQELKNLFPDKSVLYEGSMNDSQKFLSKIAFQGCKNTEEEKEFYQIRKRYPDFKFEPGEAQFFYGTIHMRSGIGMNLQSCSQQIFSSFDHVHAANIQAAGRIKRLNQEADKVITRFLVSEETLEREYLMKSMAHYRFLTQIQQGKSSNEGLKVTEVLNMLRGL